MKRRRLIGSLILSAIALIWAVSMALLIIGLQSSAQRMRELAAVSLDRILGNQRYQMETVVHRMEEELLGEAVHVAQMDSLSEGLLIDRWLQIVGSDPAINSVNLATENGDSWTLEVNDTTFAFIQVAEGSRSSPPIVTRGNRREGISARVRTRLADHAIDPRSTIWFSQSLGTKPNAPTWGTDTIAGAPQLHVSTILRSGSTEPYRILCFTVTPHKAIERSGMRPTTHFAVYMTAQGVNLMPLDTTVNGPAVRDARQNWSVKRSKDVAMREVSGTVWASQIVPLRLNGTTLYTGAVIDTEKRSRSRERQLAKAIGEREVLDREVHHRVKNNLQVVSSLLSLQARRIEDDGPRAEFMRSKRRIDSMALVHHKLYGQKDLRAIDLEQFFTQIANSMQAMFEPKSRSVSHNVETGGITADADTAIQLGVMLCELLSNCHEHAFPYATGGHIEITVRPAGADLYLMTVSDNGRGIDRDPSRSNSELGLEIVEALADQIDGRMEVQKAKGTRVTVYFKMQGLRGVPGLSSAS
jgi:two-component sensor histidine kinase